MKYTEKVKEFYNSSFPDYEDYKKVLADLVTSYGGDETCVNALLLSKKELEGYKTGGKNINNTPFRIAHEPFFNIIYRDYFFAISLLKKPFMGGQTIVKSLVNV